MVEARVVQDDLRHWKGKIFGPVSTFDGAFLLLVLLTKLVTKLFAITIEGHML